MKKIFLTIAFVMLLGFGTSAQRDSFLNDWNDDIRDEYNALPNLPGSFGFDGNWPGAGGNGASWNGFDYGGYGNGASWTNFEEGYVAAPLGGGFLILTVLGAGYAVAKRKER